MGICHSCQLEYSKIRRCCKIFRCAMILVIPLTKVSTRSPGKFPSSIVTMRTVPQNKHNSDPTNPMLLYITECPCGLTRQKPVVSLCNLPCSLICTIVSSSTHHPSSAFILPSVTEAGHPAVLVGHRLLPPPLDIRRSVVDGIRVGGIKSRPNGGST